MVIDSFIYITFLFIAVVDYKTKEILHTPLIIMLILSIYKKCISNQDIEQIAVEILLSVFIYIIFVLIIVMCEWKNGKLTMGGGDIKLIAVMYLIIAEDIVLMMAVATIMLLLEQAIKKATNKYQEKEIALAPYFFIGYNAVIIWRIYV